MIDSLVIHHYGYAVRNIEMYAVDYLRSGWKMTIPVVDKVQNSRIAYLSKEGEILIELVAPVDEKSPVNKTLSKSGEGMYHICYEVDNISEVAANMRDDGYVLLFWPVPAAALGGKKICYLYNKKEGLVELVEK